MALTKKPITGMKNILPAETQIRDYVMNQIKDTYRSFGFSPLETPCVERIANLISKQGGDNEKLIFKILKRSEKLNLDTAEMENDLVDGGPRYDLTLPPARYYSNNSVSLPSPFKALQMEPIWRTDRPQKGRFRQFVQCDIDILGGAISLAEIKLVLTATTALGKICPDNSFTVRINDKGILESVVSHYGFPEDSYGQIFIILNKMGRIGYEGVEEGLIGAGYPEESVKRYLGLFGAVGDNAPDIRGLGEMLKDSIPAEMVEGLAHVMDTVTGVVIADFKIAFDPTLVRDMSYYTETIFEVQMEGFGGSVTGGGRYDRMIGKFTGVETPACGFSIGSERIVIILMDQDFQVPSAAEKKAYLFEKDLDSGCLNGVTSKAMKERADDMQVLVAQMNKNREFQEEQLIKEGYTGSKEFYKEALKQQEPECITEPVEKGENGYGRVNAGPKEDPPLYGGQHSQHRPGSDRDGLGAEKQK